MKKKLPEITKSEIEQCLKKKKRVSLQENYSLSIHLLMSDLPFTCRAVGSFSTRSSLLPTLGHPVQSAAEKRKANALKEKSDGLQPKSVLPSSDGP